MPRHRSPRPSRTPARAALLAALLLPVGTWAAPAAGGAREAAIADLAAGRPADAARRLRASEDPEDRCLRGRALLQAGEPDDALRLLSAIPGGAACARRAAFDAAEALRAKGDLDQAAERQATLAAPLLGPDRDREVGEWLEDFARRLLARPARDRDDPAFGLYRLALGLRRSPAARRALAEEVAKALVDRKRADAVTANAVITTLVAIDALDPTVLAPLLGEASGVQLLTAEGKDAATTRLLRMRLAAREDRQWASLLAEAEPQDSEARWLRAQALAEAEDVAASEALAPFVEDADRNRAAEASRLRAEALGRQGDLAGAREAWQRHHERFPADRDDAALNTIELQLARAAAAKGDHVGARALYDALARRLDPSVGEAQAAAIEAGWVALAANDRDDATRRFETLAGQPQFVVSEAGAMGLAWLGGLSDGRIEAARAVLRGLGDAAPAAEDVLAGLDRPALNLATRRQRPGAKITVQVQSQNLEEVEVRLHRIDPVAYVESGGTPAGLPRLDTAVIAPDRSWKTAVPAGGKPGMLHGFDLPLPDVKAGLYRVTVAGPTVEASAVLLVSDLDVVTQRAAGSLAVAVFRGGKPVDGARLQARLGDRTFEGRTDGNGLARLETPGTAGVLLVQDDGAPALVTLSDADEPAKPVVDVDLHFDRPVYLAGDTAEFRIVAHKGGQPLARQALTVAVQTAGTELPRNADLKVTTDARGVATGRVTLPFGSQDVVVRVLEGDLEHARWTLAVRPQGVALRRTDVKFTDDGAELTLTDGDGAPRVGAEIRVLPPEGGEAWSVAPVRTDALGRVVVKGPPRPVPWNLKFQVDGQPPEAHDRPDRSAMALHLSHRPAAGAGGGSLQVEGPAGAVQVLLRQIVPTAEPTKAPTPPWIQTPTPEYAADAPIVPDEKIPEGRSGRLLQTFAAVIAADTAPPGTLQPDGRPGTVSVALPDLPPGRYRATAITADGRAYNPVANTAFVVAGNDDPHVTGLRDLVPGDALKLGSAKGPLALFALADGKLLAMALATPDRPATFETRLWSGAVEILAAAPDGRLARAAVMADQRLRVRATPGLHDGAVQIAGRVTDAAGRPVAQASVLVSLFDDRLNENEGGLRTHLGGAPTALSPLQAFDDLTAALTDLRHQVAGTSIDPALLAEVARASEARSALAASLGTLGGSSIKGMALDEIVMESQGYSGMGASGSGSGGGGLGARHMQAPKVRMGATRSRPPAQGHRERVLFAVVDTDADGRFVAAAPHPRVDGQWRLEVAATDGLRAGDLNTELALPGPALLPLAMNPGRPGDKAQLRVRVTSPAAATGPFTLRVGDRRLPVDLPTQALDLGAFEPGAEVTLALLGAQDVVLDQTTWRFGMASGEAVAEGGDVLRLLAAPGGGFPAARLALDAEAPGGEIRGEDAAWRCLGLEAAAASAAAGETSEVAAALDRAILEVAAASHLRDTPAAGLCLHGARARGLQVGPPVEVSMGGADDAPLLRARALYARAVLGQTVDEAVLARMARNAEGPTRGMLARTLVALDRKAEARPLAELDDIQGILARRALGMARADDRAKARALLTPPVGDTERADYLLAVADTEPGKATGTVALTLDGATVATVDRARGFDLRVAATAGALSAAAAGVPGLRVQRERRLGSADTHPGALKRLIALPDGGTGPSTGVNDLRCGADDAPCVVRVGDALVGLEANLDDTAAPPPGWVRERLTYNDATILKAVAPAEGHVAFAPQIESKVALGPARYIIVADAAAAEGAPSPRLAEAAPTARLTWAEAEVRRGADPGPWLADLTEKDLDATALGRLAHLRFDAAMQRADLPAAELVDHFEALRERAPRTTLDFAALARIAQAYRAAGQPNRALDGWRAALGGVFLTQAAVFRRAEEVVGPLAAFRGLHGLAARYPAVPAVGSALFHLPQQVAALADDDLPAELVEQGVTATDLRLLAAEWDRAYLAEWPAGAEGAQVGFHLARTLYALRADAEAARWASIVAKRFAKAPERDGLLLIEGLALAREGEEKAALERLAQVATETFVQADGTEGPSGSRNDAWMATGRVFEARGDFKAAKEAYEKAGSDAADDRRALERVQLRVDPLMVEGDDDPKVRVTVANLAEIRARAYRVDLRTLFVRDGGLDAARNLEITGVSPTFTGTLKGHAGPHPRTYELELPLKGRGAWLVQLDGEGASGVASLVVRSRLDLTATDDGRQRRAVVTRPDGRPAAGIETRIHSGDVRAERTDVRGVVLAPSGAAILAFDGDDMAFTPASVEHVNRPSTGSPRSPAAVQPAYERNLEQRMMKQVQDNKVEFEEQFDTNGAEGIEVNLF